MDDLIGRWVAGDQRAADELYRRYYVRVKEFVLKLGSNLTDAEDVAQEALTAGLEGLRSGKRPDRFTYWLLGIAKHVAAKKRRIDHDDLPDLEDPRRGSARTLIVRQEMSELLEETLRDLPSHDREVLELLHRGNLSRKEIAEKLNLPVETIHARCERAYARLRAALSRHFTTLALTKNVRPNLDWGAIRRLRPAFRASVTARHLEDLSQSRAAAKLGIPEITLQARLQSAYELLKCDPDADFSQARAEWRRERTKGDKETRETK